MRFVLPRATAPSGGHAYNQEVLQHWPGPRPEVVELEGRWPEADEQARARLAEALLAPEVLLDGLVGAAHPDLIERAVNRGAHVVLLIHLPLAQEGGLPEEIRDRLDALEARSITAAGAVVATSHHTAMQLQERHGRSVLAAPPGVASAPLADVPGPTPHIVQIGAVGPRKNQLLTCYALQANIDLSWRATLAGPVVDADYARQVDEALPRGAQRVPALDADGVSTLLRSADLLLHPAQAETFGMVITEALAHGVPTLVVDGTGAVEALTTGTPPGHPLPGRAVAAPYLAEALRAWLSDDGVRQAWREAALLARENLPGWGVTAAILHSVTRPAERIAADWLALRRGADHAARAGTDGLISRAARFLGSGGTAIDVGAGTGANHAFLAPRLPGTGWLLLDHDADLLEYAGEGERVVGGIEELPRLVAEAKQPVLVTASALLDLLSAAQLEALATLLHDSDAMGLFGLTVDGQLRLTPVHEADELVRTAFNDHQRRGGRPGPEAATYLGHHCQQLGLRVTRRDTPWQLDTSALTHRLLRERAAIAEQQEPAQAQRIRDWLAARLAEPMLRLELGHIDLLIEPSGWEEKGDH